MVYILAHNIDSVCAVFSAQQINYRVKLARIFHIIYTYASCNFFRGFEQTHLLALHNAMGAPTVQWVIMIAIGLRVRAEIELFCLRNDLYSTCTHVRKLHLYNCAFRNTN